MKLDMRNAALVKHARKILSEPDPYGGDVEAWLLRAAALGWAADQLLAAVDQLTAEGGEPQ